MRGFPLLQSILVVLAVLVAGVPVYRLTRPARAQAAAVSTVAAQPTVHVSGVTPVDVEAVFAPAPADFQIKTLDQTVLAGIGPKTRFTARWAGSVPPEGVDFVVQAHWPEGTGADAGLVSAAARIAIRLPDGRTVEKSFWAEADGTLTDVLTLPGATLSTGTP